MPVKIGNRTRRLASKIKALLQSTKDVEQRISAVMENDELSAEDKATTIDRLRMLAASGHQQANRLKNRQRELAYEDRAPNAAAPRGQDGNHFPSHTDVLLDRGNATKWMPVSRRQCKCSRAFHTVVSAYAAR